MIGKKAAMIETLPTVHKAVRSRHLRHEVCSMLATVLVAGAAFAMPAPAAGQQASPGLERSLDRLERLPSGELDEARPALGKAKRDALRLDPDDPGRSIDERRLDQLERRAPPGGNTAPAPRAPAGPRQRDLF